MDAHAAAGRAPWSTRDSAAATAVARAVADALLAVLAMAACVVWARRAGGALVEPLPVAALFVSGGVLASAALAFRWAHGCCELAAGRATSYVVWIAPSVVIVLAAAGLSLRGTSSVGLLGLYAVLVAEEAWSWAQWWRSRRTPAINTFVASGAFVASKAIVEVEPDDRDAISQYLVRRRAEGADETIDGWVRVPFQGGQRHATAHVAICPPFARTPRCYAEPADGPSGTVRVAQVLPYGVRFEIKLDQPADEACSMTVEMSIQEAIGSDDES